MDKIMVQKNKKFCYHKGIVCVTCPNLLKMGIGTGDMKSWGKTLWWLGAQFTNDFSNIIQI